MWHAVKQSRFLLVPWYLELTSLDIRHLGCYIAIFIAKRIESLCLISQLCHLRLRHLYYSSQVLKMIEVFPWKSWEPNAKAWGQEKVVWKLQGCSIKLMSKRLTMLVCSTPERARSTGESRSHCILSTELMKAVIS